MASVDSGAASNSEEHCEEIDVEKDAAGTSSANANRCNKASAGNNLPWNPEKKDATPYSVYVPYKCLMGCHNNIVTVFNSTLKNARRHVATFHNVLLPRFNASFTAGRQSSNVNGKQLLVATMNKGLVNLNNSPSTITPIVMQSQLDDQIMVGTISQ
ncbi:hypothetical protein DAPPUDRAFT_108034 [Daphnia pulex]|uniref:Uncharacterized protein n=1 Tax=Daphnia pulex TaxID=6669 RepID=E9GYY5_DAPPU|nr:hypothetical protein DAPPUDRAFT_108034 [Daphnia pulex]|eukprot:EFX75324.1 hypothetical protein DAPPUDRAFT_108034 [Daphnia pulex]